jgi:monoamine oxidase
MQVTIYDTIVIGAGAAGIAAARKLVDEGQNILVLEARDRIGGRIWTATEFAQFPIELGAEFIHGENAVTHEIIQSLGLHTIDAPRKANLWFSDDPNAVAKPLHQLPEQKLSIINAVFEAENNLPKVDTTPQLDLTNQ